jgi:hypothetical protein
MYVNRETVGFRHVAGDELNAGLLEVRQKMDIAREPIELGNEQHGARAPGVVHRLPQLGASGVLAALDLGLFAEHVPVAAVQEVDHGLALSIEAGTPLARCRHPEIADEAAHITGAAALNCCDCCRFYGPACMHCSGAERGVT